jgi:hypothetical protein
METISPPNIVTRRASALAMRRMSYTATMMSQGESSQETRDYEALESMENANDDVFTQYYAIDMPMTDMTVPDAEKIVDKFNRSCWTGKVTDFYFYFYFFFGY